MSRRGVLARIGPLWIVVSVALWWSLSGPEYGLGIAAMVGVGVGMILYVGLGGRSRTRPSLRGIVRFSPWFMGQLFRAGIDVSRRALAPSLPVDPDLIEYRIGLPEGIPRIFFVNSISLLPGTFSARLAPDRVTVHRLAPDVASEATLRRLEEHVAALFGVEGGIEGGIDVETENENENEDEDEASS
ncbi:MAG TPA: Na+/H+ antiporter subunit E [Longimicrobiales bacterium]|nr:Na+/H+ antiporter subunit E [Longimicrobiales bacterium]